MDENKGSVKGYAVVVTGGKQHRVMAGKKITVEKIEGNIGDEVTLSEVLMVKPEGDAAAKIGTPKINGATVKAKIMAQDRAPKVIIFKKRRRKGYTKKQGHRQNVTHLMIESING